MAQQTQMTDDVVRKIQLLLNLAERAEGNEAEAAAAMAKAQEILAKYNLDLATVQDKVVAGGTNATKEEARREKADAKRNATYEWTRALYKAVADANYCKYWTAETRVETKGGKARWVKRHRVLGRVDNTTVVLMMGDYLYATIMRLLPYDKSTWLSADAIAWCEGCVERLAERVAAKAEAMRTPDYATQGEAGYCTAMAVRSMAEAEKAGNYDAEHGAGAWARKLAYEAGHDARMAEWHAEVAERDARKAKELEAQLAAETPKEREKRERAEAKAARESEAYSRRYWDREDKRSEREERKRLSDAFRSGRSTGGSIGLDGQVGGGTAAKELA